MRGPKLGPLSVNEKERRELQRLARRHSMHQQIALRSPIILEADAGLNNSQVARQLDLTPETVRVWRKRWLAFQAVTLTDLSVAEWLNCKYEATLLTQSLNG